MRMKTWAGELRVFAVSSDGCEVRVDLVGGDEPVCASFIYEFEDIITSERNIEVLRRWRDAGTAVLAFAENEVVSLVDPSAVVQNLLNELFV